MTSSASQPQRVELRAADPAAALAEAPEGASVRVLSAKGRRTRARLIEAAKSVFERDGFLEARITDITKAAKVAPGTFYHYFDSKEEIFREVALAQEQRLTAPPESGLGEAGADASIWDRIRRSNRRYLERYRDEAALMGVIEQVSRYDAQVNEARIATTRHFVNRAERAILRLQREGAADHRLDPAFAADALGSMVARFAELWLVQHYRDYDFDEAVEQLTLLWANALGLRPEPPSQSRTRGR
ncbi:TetR/AcrR family transcriptional regulator [Frankia sp. AgB1.9]|uniref:TetR/AcrR family transcriptional regulator n=1 Tax=unclassified Frankia TaxID=2632575 RepID=UPI00193427BA|nr:MULTISPECIES: TetR/AcrR family transcriptional regulator [unclassified Frankia]MBL7494250.1 TetR/AcrR family transcriptional regulator [Frankia sp. AgW1.1]MBL7552443.1 TetR/AcrR family transcriptional regulator [Frankia sp. AgB1.9]MBL7623545.1 TetR/AcrR family transcriptional regulator [Frankia sp. AgB1.8]